MKTVKAMDFFKRGLFVFLLLGGEFFVLFIENFIYGKDMFSRAIWSHWYAIIFHWIITIIIWITGSSVLYKWIKKNGLIMELFEFNLDRNAYIMVLVGCLSALLYTFIEVKIGHQTFPQIYGEYKVFIKMYGNAAIMVSLVQNIYYVVESFLTILMIAFFQRAGELYFKINAIPWGGIGLSLTWGLGHLFSHPEGLLYILTWALIAGIIYIVSKKNFYASFIAMLLLFIL